MDKGTTALLNRTESGPSAAAAAAASALQTVKGMLGQSASRLCSAHMLRHKAHRLQVYAYNLLPEHAGHAADLVEALELCVEGMAQHLSANHPELAFYRHWLAKALSKHAATVEGKPAKAKLLQRAKAAREAAAAGLAVAYGRDHPTVAKWRTGTDDAWFVGGGV